MKANCTIQYNTQREEKRQNSLTKVFSGTFFVNTFHNVFQVFYS
jgi:hypothetical protein